MQRKSQTPSDRGAESHSSIADVESELELASGIGLIEGWTAEVY